MKLQELRESTNLTQERVADVLGVERSTISKWEIGKSMPRAKKLSQLAKLYNCTTDELLEAVDPTYNNPTPPHPKTPQVVCTNTSKNPQIL